MSALRPATGVSVGGRYELTSRIAGGGMGEVWAARDQVLGRPVAVKLLRGEYADDPAFQARFRTEAQHAASLSHPGIASVYDYGEDGGAAFLVMELVPGEPLSARLSREGALTPAVAIPLLQQAATAIQAAHSVGLVHRDVKPANLLITPSGQVKVTDFGIARLGADDAVTATGEVMGTAQYLSPEQALGQRATAASDVYSLGVVAYETIGGRRPFEADSAVAVAMAHVRQQPAPLPGTVPPALAAVVMQALAKDPAQRPSSAEAFGHALGAAPRGMAPVTAALPVITRPVPAAAPTEVLRSVVVEPLEAADPRRGRGWVLLALLALAAAAAVLYAVLNQAGGTNPGVITPSATGPIPAPSIPSGSSSSASTPPAPAVTSAVPTSPPPSTPTPTMSTPTTATPTPPTTATPTPTPTATSTPPSATTTTPSSSASTPPSPPGVSTASPTPTDQPTPTVSITIDSTTYVGRDAKDVQNELRSMGLRTHVEREKTDRAPPGTVLFLAPGGPFAPGDTVTIQVAQANGQKN